MKYGIAFLFCITLLTSISCHNRERYGGRMTINAESGVVTPLNQESCYYLAYESLFQNNSKNAKAYLQQMESFPQPAEKKIILEEGAKTLWALAFLEEKNYTEALIYMRKLQPVTALYEEPIRRSPYSSYEQLRRIRSASLQLRKSLPALEAYMLKTQEKVLTTSFYESLKNQWNVNLKYQIGSRMLTIYYPFPEFSN